MKINTLTLRNFKFFYGEYILNFDNKNVLIYGENGSGKSSIYWALYTMLNNAKSNDAKIQRYFRHGDDKRLLNRFMSDDDTGEVSIRLDDGRNYTISADPAQININKPGDTTIKESNIASDFISYKLLSKLYDFKHGDEINLFELFESDIFDYLQYNNTSTYADEWQNLKRIERDPPRKNSWAYHNFMRRVEQFNNKFKTFIESIREDVNTLLTRYFSANYEVAINYRDMYYNDRPALRKNRNINRPKILITIRLTTAGLSERNSKVKKPHTFLNEAKLTAIALSIRLAILRSRVSGDNILKILVLDDLLISLDMSNRDIVVNMLLEDEYLKDYQIIMLTHDRAFYERTKQIFDYKAKGAWKYFEMYQNTISKASNLKFEQKSGISLQRQKPSIFFGNVELPLIKEFGTESSYKTIAQKYFNQRDYPAAANYLRKEVERLYYTKLDLDKLESVVELARKVDNFEILKENLPPLIKALKAFEKCKDIPERKRVKKCIEFANKVKKALEALNTEIKKDSFFNIGLIKDHILNPQSHYDFSKPIYRKELEDAFLAIEELQKAVDSNILLRIQSKKEALRNKKRKPKEYRRRDHSISKPLIKP